MLEFLKKADEPICGRRGKCGFLAASFLIPCLLLVLCLAALHITPFGEHSLILSDGDAAYLPVLSFLGRLCKGEEGILYSFKNGLGGNNLSNIAWGPINPLFALSVFGDPESYPDIYTWISVLNCALAGLTMAVLLGNIFGWRVSNLLFSTSYALIGFNVVNNFQITFFAGVQVLPLMALGLYRILRKKSPALYIISLAYCIFANFFFGFILCIASVVFFIAYTAVHWQDMFGYKKRIFITYTVSSLLAGFLPAFILLPTVKAMIGGGRIGQTTLSDFSMRENMPFIRIFAKLFTGAHSTSELSDGLPAIFCGVLITALVILYFLDRNREKKEKIGAACVCVFYLVTFYIVAFSSVMQGFSHTVWFNYRYSFVFSFILIMLAAEEYHHIAELTWADAKKVFGIIVLAAVLIFSQSFEFISGSCILLDLALLAGMGLGFYIYKTKPEKSPERLLSAFLLFLVCGNLYGNYIICTSSVMEWEMDAKEYAEHNLFEGSAADALRSVDTSLYRMETENPRSKLINHDALLYNYQGVCDYSPMERGFIRENLNRLGLTRFSYGNYYSEGAPAALDSLLGIKYILAKNDLTEQKQYDRKGGSENYIVYQNPYALSFAVEGTSALDAVEIGDNAFENLNAVWRGLTGGTEDIFVTEPDVTFSAHNEIDGLTATAEELAELDQELENAEKELYIEASFTAQYDGPVYFFDMAVIDTDEGQGIPSVQYVGNFKKGEPVTYHVTKYSGDYFVSKIFKSACSYFRFAYADSDLLAGYAKLLQERDCTVQKDSERVLSGTFTATETENRLFFSIPWDEGWTCWIDGEKAEISLSCGCFMTVAVPAGTHTYEMRFFPAWMKAGIVVSCCSMVLLAVYLFLWNRNHRGEHPDDWFCPKPVYAPSGSGAAPDAPLPEHFVDVPASAPSPAPVVPSVPRKEPSGRDAEKNPCGSDTAVLSAPSAVGKASDSDKLSVSAAGGRASEPVPWSVPSANKRAFAVSLKNPLHLYILLTVISLLAIFLVLLISHGGQFQNWFFYSRYADYENRDTGMDFFNSIVYLKGNDPYGKYNTLYPPLANLFFKILFHFVPAEISDLWADNYYDALFMCGTYVDLRTHQSTLMLFIFYNILILFAAAVLSRSFLKHGSESLRNAAAFCVIFSYGFMYAFERGNIILAACIFTMIFLLWYQSENKLKREIALLSLAAAAGLKLYPALFGLLLLKNKQFKEAIRTVLYGILAVILPCFALRGGLSNISKWLEITFSNSGSAALTWGLPNFLQLNCGIFGITLPEHFSLVFSILLSVPAILAVFFLRNKWEQVLSIAAAIVLIFNQGTYIGCFFVIPLLLFFEEEYHTALHRYPDIWFLFLLNLPVPLFGIVERYLFYIICFAGLYITFAVRGICSGSKRGQTVGYAD